MQYPPQPPPAAAMSTISTSTSTQQPPLPQSETQLIDADSKILSDLSVVNEKITLCQSMLVNIQSTNEIDVNESLLTVIGFLEACVPRVRELIDVGMGMNCLKEETLTKCFQVNDDLCKILDDVDHPENVTVGASTSTSTSTSATANANATASSNSQSNDVLDSLEFDAFGFEDKKRAVIDGDDHDLMLGNDPKPKAATSAVATSALEDLLTPPSQVPMSPSAKSPGSNTSTTSSPEKKPASTTDDFDDFVGKRVNQSNSFSIDE